MFKCNTYNPKQHGPREERHGRNDHFQGRNGVFHGVCDVGHIRGGVRLHCSATGDLFRAQRHFAGACRLFAGACRLFDHARLQFAGARRHCGWGEGISHPTPLSATAVQELSEGGL